MVTLNRVYVVHLKLILRHCKSTIFQFKKLIKRGEKKTAEELVDVEYISLHGYIKNTPSDRAMRAEHQLRVDRST